MCHNRLAEEIHEAVHNGASISDVIAMLQTALANERKRCAEIATLRAKKCQEEMYANLKTAHLSKRAMVEAEDIAAAIERGE